MKTQSQSAFYTMTAGGATSSSPANPSSDSERLAHVEAMLEELLSRLFPDRDNGTGPISLERAIREFKAGNRKPLQNFKRRGGKIIANP
jgi:hypothetical protein